MKKVLACLLAALMLMGVLAACGKTVDDSQGVQTTTTTGQAVTEPAVTTQATAISTIPDRNLEGWDFNLLCHQDDASGVQTFDAQELNGSFVNDELYARQTRMEEKFNFHYNVSPSLNDWNGYKVQINNLVKSGDDTYNCTFVLPYCVQSQAVNNELFYNMLAVENIDLTQPWWHQQVNDAYTLYDYLPYASGDFSLNSYQYANLLAFNKNIAENMKIENLYDAVRDYKWTLETMYRVIEQTSNDLNGNGMKDDTDQFGFCTNFSFHALSFGYAIGEQGVINTPDGFKLGYTSEKFVNLCQWLYELLYKTNYCYELEWGGSLWGTGISWDEDRVFLLAVWLIDLDMLKTYESDFGVLPYPLYDEDQTKYYTYDDTRSGAFAIPMPVKEEDREKVGFVLEAMSADSYDNLIPNYIDNILTVRNVRDEDSADMMSYIMDGRIIDIGYAIPDGTGYSWIIQKLGTYNGNVASMQATYKSIATKFYDKLSDGYEKLGARDW